MKYEYIDFSLVIEVFKEYNYCIFPNSNHPELLKFFGNPDKNHGFHIDIYINSFQLHFSGDGVKLFPPFNSNMNTIKCEKPIDYNSYFLLENLKTRIETLNQALISLNDCIDDITYLYKSIRDNQISSIIT